MLACLLRGLNPQQQRFYFCPHHTKPYMLSPFPILANQTIQPADATPDSSLEGLYTPPALTPPTYAPTLQQVTIRSRLVSSSCGKILPTVLKLTEVQTELKPVVLYAEICRACVCVLLICAPHLLR